MVRSISAALQAHLNEEATTIAMLWRLTRQDDVVMGFTNYDVDIEHNGLTYVAMEGFSPSEVKINDDFSVNNSDVEGILSSGVITEAHLSGGVYDFATVEVFYINPNDVPAGAILIKRGYVGEVQMNNGTFVAEVRGLGEHLQRTIGEVYSPNCRATLGDARCGVDIEVLTVAGSVTEVIDNQTFKDSSLTQENAYFIGGRVKWTSGSNNLLTMEVKEFLATEVVLMLPMTSNIDIGDTFEIISGCDKSLKTCNDKFSNILNFRGEPNVPGNDKIFETSGTTTNRSIS